MNSTELIARNSYYRRESLSVLVIRSNIRDNRIVSKLLQGRNKPTGLLWGHQCSGIRFCSRVPQYCLVS